MLLKVISGGQTGADQAGLEAAEQLGLETGGTAPHKYITSKGPSSELGTRFGLRELPSGNLSQMYVTRSICNIRDSDATLIFRSYSSPDTDKTWGYCMTGKWMMPPGNWSYPPFRPFLVIDLQDTGNVSRIQEFLHVNQVFILNVAGHREETFGKGIKELLLEALKPSPTRKVAKKEEYYPAIRELLGFE